MVEVLWWDLIFKTYHSVAILLLLRPIMLHGLWMPSSPCNTWISIKTIILIFLIMSLLRVEIWCELLLLWLQLWWGGLVVDSWSSLLEFLSLGEVELLSLSATKSTTRRKTRAWGLEETCGPRRCITEVAASATACCWVLRILVHI